MIKDILVNLGLGASGVAGPFAISVAEEFDAAVMAVAPAYEPFVPGTVFGDVAGDLTEPERRRLEQLADDALARFDAAARRSNLAASTRKIGGSIDNYAADVAGFARRFDLVITGQPEPRRIGGGDAVAAEGVRFESGRPIIIVPFIQKAGLKLDHVMICWDGSRAATRAIADAMPFLAKAKETEIVTMKKGKLKTDMVPGADLAAHLARHDIRVRLSTVPGGEIDAANALLSHAADSDADFIVMGGYGHSRLREFVLGGVTRAFIESMPVPTLMSH